MAHSKPKIITANGFNLVDENGTVRASLSFSKDGKPLLAFLNKNGKPYAYFTGSDEGSFVRLYDPKGTFRLGMGVSDRGIPSIFFLDKDNKLRIGISANKHSGNMITVFDEHAHPRIALLVKNDTASFFMLKDQNKPKLLLYASPDSSAMAAIGDNMTNHAVVGVLNNKPIVLLNRGGGKGVMLSYSRSDQPFVAVRHEDGIKWIRPRVDASDLPGVSQQLLELQDHLRAIGER